MQDVLQILTNGLIAGSTIGVLAISYSLVYSVLRFINFTFGEVLMLSAYAFYTGITLGGMSQLTAGIIAVVLLGVLGTLVQVGAYRPFYRHSRLACLITALGVSIVLQNAALILFQGQPLALPPGLSDELIQIGLVAITNVQAATFLVAAFLLVFVQTLVFHTRLGLRLRALADNLAMAELLGVRVDRSIAGVFLLGSCLAAATGVLLSFENVLKPTMGVSLGLQAFAACVVGGIGSIRAAVIAAFAIAVIGHFVSFALPTISPETTSFAALLLTLAFFPEGLAGSRSGAGGTSAPDSKRSSASNGACV